ncbi:MAG: hypothetical protein ACLFWG_10060 [Longimicrobiales bacterium]
MFLLLFPALPAVPGSGVPAGELQAQGAPSPEERAEALRASAGRVAGHWARGDATGMAELLSPRGIGFHTATEGQAALDPRKALAALDDLFDRRPSVGSTVVRVSLASGASDRGSAELAWDALAQGTSEVIRRTVFLGFSWSDAGWRIYEIRILP